MQRLMKVEEDNSFVAKKLFEPSMYLKLNPYPEFFLTTVITLNYYLFICILSKIVFASN